MATATEPGVAAATRAASIARALADPIRARIFDVVRRQGGEVCQCRLQPLFDVSQPTLSHHTRRLAEAGLIDVERRGRWAYYAANEQALDDFRAWLSEGDQR